MSAGKLDSHQCRKQAGKLLLPGEPCKFLSRRGDTKAFGRLKSGRVVPFRCADPLTGEMLVELRGDGQQTIFPGSTHPSDEPIKWSEEKERDPAQVAYSELLAAVKKLAARVLVARHGAGAALSDPASWLSTLSGAPEKVQERAAEWLGIERPRQQKSYSGNGSTSNRDRAYAQAALAAECEAVAGTGKGSRNNRLNEAALKTGHYVASGLLSESDVKEALEDAARANGHVKDDGIKAARATIKSGLDKGKQQPRKAPETNARSADGKSSRRTEEDRARPAYGRRSERVPRQYIAAGTTNDDVYLLDSENRRFWPVKIKTFDTTALQRDVEQLWAEAACYEAQGKPITLQQDLWPDAAEEQAARQIENPYLSILAEKYSDHQGWIRSTDVWEALGIPLDRQKAASRDVGYAMCALGFERRQIRGTSDPRGHRAARCYERVRDHELTDAEPLAG
jgi:Virulence-associated protein E